MCLLIPYPAESGLLLSVAQSCVMTLSPAPEAARLAALYEYGILDTPAEDVFDNLAQLAAQLCGTPIALLSYIDAYRQWFKAKVGVDTSEMPRRKAVCSHTMTQKNVLIVVDASGDERFITNPQGADAPPIRFYAGVSLTDSDGYTLGTLCVMDYVPHSLDNQQQQGLKALAHQAVTQLEQRRKIRRLEDTLAQANPLKMSFQSRLHQMIRQILAESATLSQGATRLLQTLGETSNWDLGEFWVVDHSANVVRCLTNWSRLPEQFAEFEKSAQSWVFAPGLGLPGQVWSNNEPIWMSDLIHNKQCLRSHIAQRVGLHSAMGCPIISENITLGVITLFSHKVQPPNDDLMSAVMGAITDQVGHFIERKQAEELQNQNLQSQLFAAIALHIRQSLRREDILNTTVAEVRQFLKVDRVLIYHFSDDWTATVIVESVDPAWRSALGTHPEDTCFLEGSWQKYQQGQVSLFANLDFATLTPCHRHLLKQFQVKASLVVPIRLQNTEADPTLWGLLIAHQCASPRHWHSYEVECLTQLADQVAIALTQVNLLDQAHQQCEMLTQQNAALEQARLESERASHVKGEVLATMSREICPPLEEVLGMTHSLLCTDLNPEQRTLVETIRASNSSVLTFINRILNASQPKTEDLTVETNFAGETCDDDRESYSKDSAIEENANDSLTVLQATQQHSDQQHAVILALKAHALLKYRKQCAPTGIDAYLSKLLSREKLTEKLDYWGNGLKSNYFTEPVNLEPMMLSIDWEQLHAISDDNAEFERELLQIFVDDTDARLAIAHLALKEQDQEQLARAAHHIKGASANIGVNRMQQVALQLEQCVLLNNFADVETLLTQLEKILDEVRNYLKNS